ncbi:MAG TPA: hypothetical protein VMT59_10455 [Gaiellaceae bacterium]|nr:hypothetical protein [Gaiellaceae bacterium]
MKKGLKRVIDRLRTAANGRFRISTSVRGGLQQPQRMLPIRVRATYGRG